MTDPIWPQCTITLLDGTKIHVAEELGDTAAFMAVTYRQHEPTFEVSRVVVPGVDRKSDRVHVSHRSVAYIGPFNG